MIYLGAQIWEDQKIDFFINSIQTCIEFKRENKSLTGKSTTYLIQKFIEKSKVKNLIMPK